MKSSASHLAVIQIGLFLYIFILLNVRCCNTYPYFRYANIGFIFVFPKQNRKYFIHDTHY